MEVLKAAVDGIQETQQETLTMLGDLIARHNELDERVPSKAVHVFKRFRSYLGCFGALSVTWLCAGVF